jgi:hypothetical protein
VRDQLPVDDESIDLMGGSLGDSSAIYIQTLVSAAARVHHQRYSDGAVSFVMVRGRIHHHLGALKQKCTQDGRYAT